MTESLLRRSELSDWSDGAACLGADPELFFPASEYERGSSTQLSPTAKAAKEICKRCLVIDDCLKEAMSRSDTFGIWGGLTMSERRSIHSTERRRKTRQ